MKPCLIDGCRGHYKARGYCVAHYNRLRVHGDPQAAKPVRPVSADPPDHGTYAGYQQHRRITKDQPCAPCQAAQTEYVRNWRHRTGRTKGVYLTPMEIGHITGKLGDFW